VENPGFDATKYILYGSVDEFQAARQEDAVSAMRKITTAAAH
jgi:hypothetical protein